MRNLPFGSKVFILIALVLLIFTVPAYAAIGVKEGDWAKYQIEADISEEIPGYEEIEELEGVKLEVESVSDTSVTLKAIMRYKNGTEHEESGIEATGFIIEADLGEGDPVLAPMWGISLYINGSKRQTYAGASREVNYVDIDLEEMGMTMDFEAYWDKATGVLCEMSMSMSGELLGETVEMSMSFKMTETNLWALSIWMQWWFWLIIVVIIAAIVGAVVLLRRKPAPPEVTTPAPATS